MIRLTLSAVLCTCFLVSFSQQKAVRINSREFIEAGIKAYDNNNFSEALKEFSRVPVGDTNYVLALYESALTCSADSQYTRGIGYCEQALTDRSNPQRDPELLVLYGSLLDYNNEPERALHVFDSAIGVYPAFTGLYINKATTLIRMKKYKDAETLLQKAVLINPYSASLQFKLGLSTLNQGKVIPGFLCMLAALTIEPTGSFSVNAINTLNQISKSTDQVTSLVSERTEEPSEDFKLIEQIVLSKIALDKSYKIKIALDDGISRQMQVVFEKLTFSTGSEDFYTQYYTPLFKKIYDEKKFEDFVNYIFSGVELPAIQLYNKKNKKRIDALKGGIVEYFNLIRATREIEFAKRNYNGAFYQYSESGLLGKGALNGKKDITGPWTFYYSAGNTKSVGTLNENSQQEGAFTYYHFNGKLKAKEFYRNGKKEGEQIYYNEQGILDSKEMFRNGEADGLITSYYTNGLPKTIENYSNGKLNGIKKSFYKAGPIQMEETWVNGKRQGPAKTYYINGQPETEGSYENDELNGPFKAWNNDGVLSAEGSYANGKLHNTLKRYYSSGPLLSVENFQNGVAEGDYIAYHENGKESYRYTNKKGKSTGDINYYDEDGKLYSTLTYDGDNLKAGKYFNKEGKLISSSESKKGKLDLTTFTPHGIKQTFAPYGEKGTLNGTKIYYFGSGKERLQENYTHGSLKGAVVGFYPSGKKSYDLTYEDGDKSGYYTSWHSSGGIQQEGWYDANKMEGEWLTYNKYGALVQTARYLNDQLSGIKTERWPNGVVHTRYVYNMNNIQSVMEYDTTGKLINTITLNNGNGVFASVYPNGKPYVNCKYENNDIQGAYTVYYPDGSPMIKRYYTNGLDDSTYSAYAYGGKLRVEGKFRMGERVGTWKHYKYGVLSSTTEYKADNANGKTTFYYPNGKVDTEIEMKNDERHGWYKRYAEDGTLMYQIRYDEGMEEGYTYLNKNGELLPEIPLPLGNGKLQAFYPNGNPSASMEFIDGAIHGSYKLYHPNGKQYIVDEVVYDNSEGPNTTYAADGTIRSMYTNKHDNLHGPYKEYNTKGILTEEGNFYNDDLHGEQRIYDDAGKLKQVRYYYYGLLLQVK